MLLQYNLKNSKTGQTKVNVIYSKNHTLSKVTIINGKRFRINYPFNFTKNLTSNIVVQKVKFGDTLKIKPPTPINNNPKPLELSVRKVRISTNPVEKKSAEKIKLEKNITNITFPINNNKNNSNIQASNLLQKKLTDEKINLANKLREDKKNLELDIINGKII